MANEILNEIYDFHNLLQVLMDLARDIEDNYKEELAANGRYTTEYALIDSVHCQVVNSNVGYDITMELNDYWKYVENGTKPHFPPPSEILQWIQIKPIIPKPDKNGKLPSEEQLAYLIGRKISKVGTKGTHDLQKTKDGIIPFYYERLQEALGHDVSDYIRKYLNG